MFHTLDEFTVHAKGWSYVLAALILLLYIPVWIYIRKGDRQQ